MTNVSSPPVRERKVPTRPPRRRLRKQMAITFGAFLVVWLAVGLLIQPVGLGEWSRLSLEFEYLDHGSRIHYDEILYSDGQEGHLGQSLRNSGPFPITLTEIDWFPTMGSALLQQQDVYITIYTENDTPRFTLTGDSRLLSEGPAVVPAGETAFLTFVVKMGQCENWTPGGAMGIDRMVVHFQHLGIPRTVEIATTPIFVGAPDDCPR